MSNDAFLEVLAGCTEAGENMDLSDDGWTPPDGTYDVQIESVNVGIKEKGGVNNAWLKPTFLVLDGEFEGKTFTDFYWIPPATTEPSMGQKKLAQFATCLNGTEVRNPIEGSEIAQAAVGEFLSMEIYRTTSKKNGKVYTNIRFLNTIQATDVETDKGVGVEATG